MRNLRTRSNWLRVALITSISVVALALAAACAPPETNLQFQIGSNGDLEWRYEGNTTWNTAVPASDFEALTDEAARAIITAETSGFATQQDLTNAVNMAGGGTGSLSARIQFLEYANVSGSVPPVQVSGSGFQPGETVSLEIPGGTTNPLATATADSSGAVAFGEVTLPSTAPTGDPAQIVYGLRATGSGGAVANTVVTVQDEIQN